MKPFCAIGLVLILAGSLTAQSPQTGTSQPDVKSKPAEKAPAVAKTADPKAPAKTSPPAASAEMPKPAPEMERLSAQLAGRWETEEKHEPSSMLPQGGTGKGIETIRPGPGGLSLLVEYKSESPMGIFSGFGIMTFDPGVRVFHLHWTDNTALGVSVSNGKWEGNNLVFTGSDTVAGKKVFSRHTISDLTPTTFTYAIEVGPAANQLKRAMTIKYAKVNIEDMRGRQIRGKQ
ncbi:MAG TPA: DUF1579 family protein [Terriglobales bacterium]|nr:DUF1579 family protein [Terriglobales bacterium]